MNFIVKYFLPIFWLILLPTQVISQTYNFKNYNTEQGLPQSQVLCVYQDHKGNMWFGTNSGGAGKYDGNKFVTLSENDGLAGNVVFSICETNKKELVFGTSIGLSIYNGLSFENYNTKNGLKNAWIFKTIADKDQVWIGTREGVFIYKDKKIIHFNKDTLLNQSMVYSIFLDKDQNPWFATLQNGVITYNKKTNQFYHFNTDNGLTHNFVLSLCQRENGDILAGTQQGICLIDTNYKVKDLPQIKYNTNMSFSYFLPVGNDNILFGTFAEGVNGFDFRLNKPNVKYNLSNGLTNNPIQCLFKDREGNLWIGTDGSGVYKYKNEKFLYYTKANGLPESYINAVAQDNNGNMWVALRSNGICKINGNSIKNYIPDFKSKNSLPDKNVNVILPTNDGKIYFGTKEGLSVFENEQFTTINQPGFKNKYILSLFQDHKKDIWIGTNEGLYKYSNSTITNEKPVNDLKQQGSLFEIFTISEDKNNDIWIGTENGIIKYDRKNISIFNENTNFISRRITSSIIDKNKNLWIGTEEGVYNYDYKSFTKISQKNGLSSNFVNFLQIDNLNRLIIGSNTGIDILSINDFYSNKISIIKLKKDDGLLSLESNINSAFKDADGRILIGTINGLQIYDPKFDIKNTIEPITTINNVKLFFGQEDILKYAKSIDTLSVLPRDLVLPFTKNHITFQFAGASLSAPEKVMYQYKLEGLDDNWTPPTYKNEATYSSLPPGSYKFFVKSMNNDGVWNTTPTEFSFTISPPWYNTWWFYTISAILLIAGISLFNYVKTKKLIADKQKLEQVVEERTHELREEKEKVELVNKEVMEQKSIIEHKNIEITDSIKYAKNIQEALLPNLNEIKNLFNTSFVLYLPKDIVSGDFYWFAKNGNISFVAAVDCTGHGVPGAFMSIVGNTLLNEIVNEQKITSPGDILLELHKGVKIALNQNAKEFERRDGMDITLCAIEKGSNTIQYAGANRPLWIYRKNKNYELEIIKATKFPIGGLELEEARVYTNHTIPVDEGDCLYLFSDGYADQFGGPKGKKFMLTNLQKTLFEIVEEPMEVQKQKLHAALDNWKGDAEQIDDVLVIGIKM